MFASLGLASVPAVGRQANPVIDAVAMTTLSETVVDAAKVRAAATAIESRRNSASLVKARAARTPSIGVHDLSALKAPSFTAS